MLAPLLLAIILLLCLSLLVLPVSHSYRRLSLPEPFLGPSLTTEKWRSSFEFQQWLSFHKDLCRFWNTVITKALDTQQGEQAQEIDASGNITNRVIPPPDKPKFIQGLSTTKNDGRPFITCASLTTESPEQDILAVLPPTIQVYQDTLRFINEQVAIVKENLKKSLEGIPPPAESFADYTCTAADGSTVTLPSEAVNKAQEDTVVEKDKLQQAEEIMNRIKPLVKSFPSMKEALEQAREGVAYLETYEAKAKSGDIYKEIDIPERPVVPPK